MCQNEIHAFLRAIFYAIAYTSSVMSKALLFFLSAAAAGGAAFSFVQWNARSAADAAAAERELRIAALEQSARAALDAAKKAQDDLAIEKENVARLTKERDEARAKSKETPQPRPARPLRRAMRSRRLTSAACSADLQRHSTIPSSARR